MTVKNYNVFINCPFDGRYRPIFERIVFTVLVCGFRPRCAWELNDGGNRIHGIVKILGESRLSIHDLSKSQCVSNDKSCRFNMPFELGLDYGARNFGTKSEWRKKRFLVLEKTPHSLRKAISDINELDPKPHRKNKKSVIRLVRDFLANDALAASNILGHDSISNKFDLFDGVFTEVICKDVGFDRKNINYKDLVVSMVEWINKNKHS